MYVRWPFLESVYAFNHVNIRKDNHDMDDPRDTANQEDLLTEDSEDDYNDLLKEFQTKYDKLKSEKRAKKAMKDPSEDHKKEIANEDEEVLSDEEIISEILPIVEPIRNIPKPSNFINKLYQLNKESTTSKVDFTERKFSFEGLKKTAPIDISVDELEPTSNQYLRKRYVNEGSLKTIMKDTDKNIKILKIDKLLAKTNKSNNYKEPEYSNWSFLGFIVKKFQPKTGRDKKKFMRLLVGDFNRTIDLMLFGKAFDRYWKLREGDLIMILNPRVNKYQIKITDELQDGSKEIEGFNLTLDGFNPDCLIAIGALRDYGTCTAIKKSDSLKCENVINVKMSTLCEFHLDQRFKGNQNRRMELNSGGGAQMRSPKKNKQVIYANRSGSVEFMQNEKTYNEDSTVFLFQNNEKSKYYDPKLLTKNSDKRRKMDEQANEALKKRLLANLSNISKLKSLNLVKESTAKDPKQRSFSHKMISKIGYDPTINQQVNINAKVEKSDNKLIQELYELSHEKSKNRSLETSSKDIESRKERWKSNLQTSKKYEREVKQRPINNPFGRVEDIRTKLVDKTKRKNVVVDSESDSDIEIEFDTEEMKQAFNNRLNNS